MKKAIVIYRSKTGFSQQYAQWLAEELHCKVLPFRERKKENLEEYDVIILTGGLYAGQMAGLNWLKKQLPSLRGKRIAAVAVGCAPTGFPGQPESIRVMGRFNVEEECSGQKLVKRLERTLKGGI